MTASTGYRPAAAWSAIGLHWWWGLAFGVITVAAGICALVWPGITLLAAAVIFGVQLIIGGVYRLVAAFSSQDVSGGTRVLLALLGVLWSAPTPTCSAPLPLSPRFRAGSTFTST